MSTQPSATQASRLLTQATFGPTWDEITRLSSMAQGAWLEEQFAKPSAAQHKDTVMARITAIGDYGRLGKYFPHPYSSSQEALHYSFWRQAKYGPDQLRQRVGFALSEIFVVSYNDTDVLNYPRGYADYLDMLNGKAFGNFREVLEAVTLHPMMGLYLSALANQKENGTTTPDENFAREVMQLFSIGVYQLNIDGTPKLNAKGEPIETYTNDDITGMAKVMTGFSWYHPTKTDNNTFLGGGKDIDADVKPMKAYPQFHSTSEKRFLGTTIPASTTPNPAGDLRIALDTIFNHPNVGPFISRQLIQRLVTSNPSPAYVARVANTFNNNGKGVRGDLKAVLTAILMDSEARDDTLVQSPSYGKIREPILRLSSWMRAFDVNWDDPNVKNLGGNFNGVFSQTPMYAPSVFNFFSPNYIAPNSATGRAGLVAPELQITDTVTVAAFANKMYKWVRYDSENGLKANYTTEIALASTPDALIERLNLLLMSGQMSADMKTKLRTAINTIPVPATGDAAIKTAQDNRARLAVLMTLLSPQYMVQK